MDREGLGVLGSPAFLLFFILGRRKLRIELLFFLSFFLSQLDQKRANRLRSTYYYEQCK